MPFAAAAAAVGVAGSVAGGMMQSSAANKASKAAQKSQREALAQQREIFDLQRADQMPYMDVGQNALADVADLSGANGVEAGRAAQANFLESPGYQFQLEQGQKAIDRSAAARGMLRSGATMEASQKFGQGLAAQDFTTYYNRLAGLAGMGQQSANAVSNAASNLSNKIGEAGQGIAQTQMANGAAQASITGNMIGGVTNSLTGAFGNAAYGQAKSGF